MRSSRQPSSLNSLVLLQTETKFSDFTLYFLAFDHSGGAQDMKEKEANRTNREGMYGLHMIGLFCHLGFVGVLELTHNHGTETDPDFKGYASGNSDPGRGFGHIA